MLFSRLQNAHSPALYKISHANFLNSKPRLFDALSIAERDLEKKFFARSQARFFSTE